jgi:hypothetical protein
MESADLVSPMAVPQDPASVPVDPKTLFGSDGDVNGLASTPIVGTTVAFVHEDLGFAPNREPVHHPFNVMVEWEDGEVTSETLKSNGDYYDALTAPTVRPGFPNVISPFPSSTNSDSDFEGDHPDLVLTESDELSTASADGFITLADYSPDLVFTDSDEIDIKYAGRSVTLDNDICASLFGDDDTTVDAAYYTIDGDGDDAGRSSEAVSSLFTAVRTELAVFSREISSVMDEFELDCLAAQAELADLLGPPPVAPGEPNGAPGAVVAATDSGDSAVADVLSMHLPSLGGEILPLGNSFDFAVAVVTVNGETKEADMPGFLVRTDLKQSSVIIPCNKLVDGKQSLQVVVQLAKLSMHGLCIATVDPVQALVAVEIWNSNLVQVTLQQHRLGSEGDVDDSKWRLVGTFHCLCLGGTTTLSTIGSGVEAEPKLLCIGGRSVHSIPLLCKNPVDAKSCTFSGIRTMGTKSSTSAGIRMPLMVCGETADSQSGSAAVGSGVLTAKDTTFLAALVRDMKDPSFQVSSLFHVLGAENVIFGEAFEGSTVDLLLSLAPGPSSCHDIILQCFHWKFVKDKFKPAGSPSWTSITSGDADNASVFNGSVDSTGVSFTSLHFCGCTSSKVNGVVLNLEHGGKTDGDPDKDSDKEPDGATDGEPLVLETATYGSEFAAASWIERSANGHRVTSQASNHKTLRSAALVDRGANGCVIGVDCRPIPDCPRTHRTVDVEGIDGHQITDIPILSAAGVTNTQLGPVIAIFHQAVFTGKGKSILSCAQMEWHQNSVNDQPVQVTGGLPCIETLDGYVIPINIRKGLSYIQLRPFSDNEWEDLPHVMMTSDTDWDFDLEG